MVAPTSYRWSMVSLMLANVSCDGVCVAQQAVAHKGEPSARRTLRLRLSRGRRLKCVGSSQIGSLTASHAEPWPVLIIIVSDCSMFDVPIHSNVESRHGAQLRTI